MMMHRTSGALRACLGASLALGLGLLSTTASAQTGPEAMVFCGDNGYCDGTFFQLEGALRQAGAQDLDDEATLTNLQNYRLIFVMVPRDGLSLVNRQLLRTFYLAGGALVLVGEHGGFDGQANQSLNTLLQELGSDIRLTDGGEEQACGDGIAEVFGDHPLLDGVVALQYAWTSPVSAGGELLARGFDDNLDLVRVGERLVVSGDSNLWNDDCAQDDPFFLDTNLQFFFNQIGRAHV